MKKYTLEYKPLGSISALIVWPEKINTDILDNIIALKSVIEKEMADVILDSVPAYNTLTVYFDTSKIKYSSVIKKVKHLYEKTTNTEVIHKTLWHIPVCFDFPYGLDLREISWLKEATMRDVINEFLNQDYDVSFFGEEPGLLFLGGLTELLQVKRRDLPRKVMPEGSVAIWRKHLGIIPADVPGNWNIIGRTPVKFFDLSKEPFTFVVPGDKLRFHPIEADEYKAIKKQVIAGTYKIESEAYG